MWSKWISVSFMVIKEFALLSLLTAVMMTMIGGFLLLGILNLPQSLWDPQSLYAYIGLAMVLIAPLLALARVIEWWIAAYVRFSAIFPRGEQR